MVRACLGSKRIPLSPIDPAAEFTPTYRGVEDAVLVDRALPGVAALREGLQVPRAGSATPTGLRAVASAGIREARPFIAVVIG